MPAGDAFAPVKNNDKYTYIDREVIQRYVFIYRRNIIVQTYVRGGARTSLSTFYTVPMIITLRLYERTEIHLNREISKDSIWNISIMIIMELKWR